MQENRRMSASKKIYSSITAAIAIAILAFHYSKRVDVQQFNKISAESKIADIQKDEWDICYAAKEGSDLLILSNLYKKEALAQGAREVKDQVTTTCLHRYQQRLEPQCFPQRPVPFRPCCDCGHLRMVGSLLYWQPEMGGMECEFATFTILESVSGGTTTSIALVEDTDPQFLWDFGYRLGIDYRFACSLWEGRILYTHFDGGAVRKKDETKNSGNWHLHYNIIEGALARPICINSCFSLVPLGGIRYANIRQSITADIFTKQFSGTVGTLYSTDISDRQRYYGIGPEWGLIGQYDIGCRLKLFGGIEGAVLYGKADIRHFEEDIFPGYVQINNSHNISRISQLCLDACFGIDYTWCCCCRRVDFALAIEQHRIFNHNFMTCCSGNLVLNGFSLSVSFDF